MYPTLKSIHFVGIGGIGMSGLAEILLTLGCRVTGSDLKKSPITDRLRRRGARIFIGHRSENLTKGGEAQVVVISSAIAKNNPEVHAAEALGIPIISRGEMLAELMRLKYGIAIAGSHGKTTTTSLIASVLDVGGFDPTVVIGGRVKSLRSNARLGRGDFLVAEADESDGSFLHLNPTIAVVTNIDREHMDHYRDFEALRKTFLDFVSKIPFYGLAVLCADHPETARLAEQFPKRMVTYGIREKADYQAVQIRSEGWGSSFHVKGRGEDLGKIRLQQPGLHNVLNSLASIAVGRELGIRFSDIRKALGNFSGIGRRLEVIHKNNEVLIVDDYGHHPEEIKATLSALRAGIGKKRLWVLFQPHRYTRTKDLFQEFTKSFADADEVVLTNIYAASEEPIHGVSGESLAEAVREETGKPVQFVSQVDQISESISPRLKRGDVILTLGAGDIWKAGRDIVKKLNHDGIDKN